MGAPSESCASRECAGAGASAPQGFLCNCSSSTSAAQLQLYYSIHKYLKLCLPFYILFLAAMGWKVNKYSIQGNLIMYAFAFHSHTPL